MQVVLLCFVHDRSFHIQLCVHRRVTALLMQSSVSKNIYVGPFLLLFSSVKSFGLGLVWLSYVVCVRCSFTCLACRNARALRTFSEVHTQLLLGLALHFLQP